MPNWATTISSERYGSEACEGPQLLFPLEGAFHPTTTDSELQHTLDGIAETACCGAERAKDYIDSPTNELTHASGNGGKEDRVRGGFCRSYATVV